MLNFNSMPYLAVKEAVNRNLEQTITLFLMRNLMTYYLKLDTMNKKENFWWMDSSMDLVCSIKGL